MSTSREERPEEFPAALVNDQKTNFNASCQTLFPAVKSSLLIGRVCGVFLPEFATAPCSAKLSTNALKKSSSAGMPARAIPPDRLR